MLSSIFISGTFAFPMCLVDYGVSKASFEVVSKISGGGLMVLLPSSYVPPYCSWNIFRG